MTTASGWPVIKGLVRGPSSEENPGKPKSLRLSSIQMSISSTFTRLRLLTHTDINLYKSIYGWIWGSSFNIAIEMRFSLCLPPVQMCCDCCVLGLMASSRGLSCELQGLSLERQCAHKAKTCCGENMTEETKPNNKGNLKKQTLLCLD